MAYLISTSWTELVSLVAGRDHPHDQTVRNSRPTGGVLTCGRFPWIDIAGGVVVVAILALAPVFASSNYLTGVLTVCAIYASGLRAGISCPVSPDARTSAHSLFIGAGAYTAGFMATIWFTNPWYSLPAAVAVAVVFSIIVGFPTLRLRGPYFALAMLSASAILQRLLPDLLGIYRRRGRPLRSRSHDALAAALLLVRAGDPRGHRDRADAAGAIALGPSCCAPFAATKPPVRRQASNVTFYKIASLTISAAFAGLGGALYAHYQLQVSPTRCSRWWCRSPSSSCVTSAASARSTARPLLRFLLTLLTEMLRGFGEYRLWIYTLTLMFILFFLPNGLVAPFWRRLTERFR